MPELETRAEPDDRDRSASDPERGLSAAEVAERVARGQVNDVPAAPTRTVAQIVRAQRLHAVQRAAGRDARGDPGRGPAPGRAVRVRPDRERGDRDRAGAAGEADPRPAHRAHRAEGARRARRRGPRGRRRRGRPRRRPRRSRAGSRSWWTARCSRRRARGRRVAAHRRVRSGGEGAGRRGAVGLVRRGRLRALPRERWAPRPTRCSSAQEARRFTLTHSELRSGIDHDPHRT